MLSFRIIIQKIILTIFILPVLSVQAADWHRIPIATTEDFNGLHFINENKGFLVTKQGSIFMLQMRNDQWDVRRKTFDYDFENIFFLDDGKTGFAFGTDGVILRTTDAGQSWHADTISPGVRFMDMVFFDSLNGVVIGNNYRTRQSRRGVAFITADGGKSWDSLKLSNWKMETINLSPEGVAAIVGRQSLFISTNKGKNWVEAILPPKITAKAASISEKHGIMVGMGGLVAISEDYGMNWKQLDVIPERISLFDILKIDRSRYYASCTQGEILYTEDGGNNWIPEASGAYHELFDLQKVGKRVFACGKQGGLTYTVVDEKN